MNRLAILLITLATAAPCVGEELTQDQIQFFEAKIRPVLANSCYECHSNETGQNKGGLTLDTKLGLRQGGNSGPGIVPYKLDDSWVWTAISHADSSYKMPPKSKLPATVIADFKKWILMGAPDPRDDGLPAQVTSDIDVAAGREFWSYQPPRQSAIPERVSNEWKTPIDRYVFAQLAANGMQPTERAQPEVLLKRLHFDLIGLPPTLAETEEFSADWQANADQAVASAVDRLLASERFGERWGRHWLDVARYAESNGKESNQSFPTAWRYRDYVIDSFNQDKPYDRFVQEQIAGDLLPAKTDEQWQEGIIATGFLAMGPKDLREKSVKKFTMNVIDEQIDATTQAILGLTVACARCHDHKSDPIPTADYYAIAGIFLSSKTYYGTFGHGHRYNVSKLIVLPIQSETRENLTPRDVTRIKARLAELDRQMAAFREGKRERMMRQANGPTDATDSARRGATSRRIRQEQSELNSQLGSMSEDGKLYEHAMGMQDKDTPQDAHILVRGEVDSPAQQVPRGFLQVLNHGSKPITPGTSGRLELARWLTSPENPLTARVFVNRVWGKLFGRGIVSTSNNFGVSGLPPSHPQLLDHLAVQFMQDDWSTKRLIRSIVLTRAYQASSRFDPDNFARDPDNEFLWRAAPRRLDAEALRDAILATSGKLNLARPHGSAVSQAGDLELGRRASPDVTLNLPPYRSVYVPAIRNVTHELLRIFDGADLDVVTGSRDNTNVAGQALYMMNSPFLLSQADAFAERVSRKHDSTRERIEYAFELAYGRRPSQSEMQSTVRFYQNFVPQAVKETGSKAQAEKLFLNSVCQGLLASAEFRFVN